MNAKKVTFNFFMSIFCLVFFVSANSTEGAITKTQPNKKQAIVFFVETNDLAGLKQALVDVNLHLRKEGRSNNQPINVVVHGSGVRFFSKVGMDPDLEYMLKWFQGEQIYVSLCGGCLVEYGVDKESLVAGMQIWKSRIPITPSRSH